MAKMRLLAPKLQTLRERFGDDRMKLNQEMMALYKAEQVNPAAGCLPVLLQIPVFFALYKVLFVTIECGMRHFLAGLWICRPPIQHRFSTCLACCLIPCHSCHLSCSLAFAGFDGHFNVPSNAINPAPPDPIR